MLAGSKCGSPNKKYTPALVNLLVAHGKSPCFNENLFLKKVHVPLPFSSPAMFGLGPCRIRYKLSGFFLPPGIPLTAETVVMIWISVGHNFDGWVPHCKPIWDIWVLGIIFFKRHRPELQGGTGYTPENSCWNLKITQLKRKASSIHLHCWVPCSFSRVFFTSAPSKPLTLYSQPKKSFSTT